MAVPEPTPEDIRASYGFVAELANQVPELQDLLQQAVAGQWTPDRFVMSVANTEWWRTNGAGARDWMLKVATDPDTATRDKWAGGRELGARLDALGIPHSQDLDDLGSLWVRAKIEQITPEGMDAFLLTAIDSLSDETMREAGGKLGATITEMYKLAKEYGYQSPDLTGDVLDQARKVMLGGLAGGAEEWRTKMINYAASYYAPYADDIRGGKTVDEVARPVMDRVAALLEVTPDQLNFADPILKKALTEWNSSNGVARAYSLREIEDMTRKDSRWATTDNAMESATNLITQIGEKFGFLPKGSR